MTKRSSDGPVTHNTSHLFILIYPLGFPISLLDADDTDDIVHYYMAGAASGKDEANPTL